MRPFVSSGFIAGVVLVASACGSPPPPEGSETRTSAVSGGQVETGYPAVGCLQGNGTCTGTLIAPNLVLSAKHCGAMTTFNTGSTCVTSGPTSRPIDGVIGYFPTEDQIPWTNPPMYPHDLVVYHLQTPIYDVRPLHINPLGYPANGTNCVAVGFGLDGMGGVGTKRSGTVTVTDSGSKGYDYQGLGWVLMYSSIQVVSGPAGSSPPPGNPESGDSGSPLLCNGEGVIRGVYDGYLNWPLTGRYYTGIETSQTWDSAWVTNVASNYVNEPMVAATPWSSSRYDLFVRGTDGAIYQKTADHGNWLPSTFGWNYIGGFITGAPEVVSWGSNRIDLFVRGGDPNPQTDTFNSMSLWHIYWNGGSSWNWQQVGTSGISSHPVAVSWGPNRLDVFALNSLGRMSHWYGTDQITLFEQVPAENGPASFLPLMKAFSTSAGNLDLYAVGTDNVLYHANYNQYGVWTDWDNLGGQVLGTPAVTTWGGGRQDIFVKSFDHNLYQKVYSGGTWSPSQQGYYSLGGPIDGAPAATSMQTNWLTLVANSGTSADETEGLAYKAWFNGSQWAPTNTTWYDFNGIVNGAATLQAAPGVGVNLYTVGGSYTPTIMNYSPTGPQPYGWSGAGSLGGIISW